MLKRALQFIGIFLGGVVLIGAVVLGAYKSSQKSLEFPTEEEINSYTNVGNLLSLDEQAAVLRSRRSAVQVMSMDLEEGGSVSSSSGTYLIYENAHLILTTSHGIGNVCALTHIVVGDNLYDCVQYVLRDPQTDYIIIQIDPLAERTPVQIPRHIPHRQEWKTDLATMNTIYYTGYPNNGGPYTFDGKIVAYSEREAIFVDSYGWSGSSGAGVFSASGNLIGYIMALEVGETYFGRQVLENFVWVIPLFKVNWPAVGAFAN
tara:strand:- start:666 stop:1448 length:783 start_codon:yes stop_codon:yes gene_type:complete